MNLGRLHAIVRAQVQGRDMGDTSIERILSPAEQQALLVWLRQHRRADAAGAVLTPQSDTVVWDRSSAITSTE